VKITLVAAVAAHGIIGRDGGMPWHLPADLAHFKAATMGKPLLMGRRTHEAIGRALPGRLNLVLSRDARYRAAGCQVVASLEEAMAVAKGAGADELMVIGGGRVYADTLPMASRILLTEVKADVEGDTAFPALDPAVWREVARQEREADERNPCHLAFVELVRRP
jgi:dihydrofolate reductase